MGWELNPETERRMKGFFHVQGGGKHQQHRYTMERFGLIKAQIESALDPYRERFHGFF